MIAGLLFISRCRTLRRLFEKTQRVLQESTPTMKLEPSVLILTAPYLTAQSPSHMLLRWWGLYVAEPCQDCSNSQCRGGQGEGIARSQKKAPAAACSDLGECLAHMELLTCPTGQTPHPFQKWLAMLCVQQSACFVCRNVSIAIPASPDRAAKGPSPKSCSAAASRCSELKGPMVWPGVWQLPGSYWGWVQGERK